MSDKKTVTFIKAMFAMGYLVIGVPLYSYLWYRLLTLTNATGGDLFCLWLYVGVTTIYTLITCFLNMVFADKE